jgi:hypothetical protein
MNVRRGAERPRDVLRMNPALMFSRLCSPPSVERRCEAAAGRRGLEPSVKLRMNPALVFSRLRSVSSVDRRCEAAAGRRGLEPSAKLRMNPAHMFSRLCSVSSVERRCEAAAGRRRLEPRAKLRMNPAHSSVHLPSEMSRFLEQTSQGRSPAVTPLGNAPKARDAMTSDWQNDVESSRRWPGIQSSGRARTSDHKHLLCRNLHHSRRYRMAPKADLCETNPSSLRAIVTRDAIHPRGLEDVCGPRPAIIDIASHVLRRSADGADSSIGLAGAVTWTSRLRPATRRAAQQRTERS